MVKTNKTKLEPNIGNKLPKKRDRSQYSSQRYQAKKQDYHEWYLQRKAEKEKQEKERENKLYQANNIKVLLTFKEYTELNQQKRQLWLDFNWTLQDFQKVAEVGLTDIIPIMKVREVADQLITDYWVAAKGESKKAKSWNSLNSDQQQRLIKYWGREKARVENNLLTTVESLEQQGQQYEKDIELAKFHEERGKEKCDCWQCATSKQIRAETKAKLKKGIVDSDRQSGASEKEQCPECKKWVKYLDENSGVCKNCLSKYET